MPKKMDIVDVRSNRRQIGQFFHDSDSRQRWSAGLQVPRHRHTEPYAQLVLAGGFQECGSRGRITVRPGDILLHGPFESHLDRIFATGTEVLNLGIPSGYVVKHPLMQISDADAVAKAAETNPAFAMALIIEQMVPQQIIAEDWADLFVTDLQDDPNYRLEDWAETHDLAFESLARGFGRAYGITPAEFRAEMRSRKAFEQIIEGSEVLGKVLEASGFSTEAHLARAIRSLTGASPKSWLKNAFAQKRQAGSQANFPL